MSKKYLSNIKKLSPSVNVPTEFCASSPSKISTKSDSAFSLPAGPLSMGGTCPGSTPACVDCYAMKGRHHFSNVQRAFIRNRKLLQKLHKNGSRLKAAKMLNNMIPKGAALFRIHESGDFMSNWYIDIWASVIAGRPGVNFWAYTRSFSLDFSSILRNNNFTLWASTDQHNKSSATKFVNKYKKFGVRHAYGPWDINKDIPENSFSCPVTIKKLSVDGACEKCMLCVVRNRVNKNVVFIEH